MNSDNMRMDAPAKPSIHDPRLEDELFKLLFSDQSRFSARRAHRSRRVLSYLIERYRNGSGPPTEREMRHLFESETAIEDAKIRRAILDLRKSLRSFAIKEGSHLPLYVDIPEGQYGLRLMTRGEKSENSVDPIDWFWRPHIEGIRGTAIGVIEPATFLDYDRWKRQGLFFASEVITSIFRVRDAISLAGGNCYLLDHTWNHFVGAETQRGTISAVLLGSSTTNDQETDFLGCVGDLGFHLSESVEGTRVIRNVVPLQGELARHEDTEEHVHALVTRIPLPRKHEETYRDGGVVTIIKAHTMSMLKTTTSALIWSPFLATLVALPALSGTSAPDCFQIVVRRPWHSDVRQPPMVIASRRYDAVRIRRKMG